MTTLSTPHARHKWIWMRNLESTTMLQTLTSNPTPQEIFDKVVTHLRQQGAQAKTPHGSCAYRDADTGHSCSAGCLIPDEKYSSHFEEKLVDNVSLGDVMTELGIIGEKLTLLMHLQSVHDDIIENRSSSKWLENLPMALGHVADRHNLDHSAISLPLDELVARWAIAA